MRWSILGPTDVRMSTVPLVEPLGTWGILGLPETWNGQDVHPVFVFLRYDTDILIYCTYGNELNMWCIFWKQSGSQTWQWKIQHSWKVVHFQWQFTSGLPIAMFDYQRVSWIIIHLWLLISWALRIQAWHEKLNTRVGQQGKRQGNFKVLKHPVALQDFCIIVTPGYDPQFSPHWEPFTEIKTLINVPVQSNPKLHGSTLHYHFLRSQNARIMSDSGALSQHTPIVLIHHLEFRPGLLLFFHDLFMAHWKGSSQAGRTQAF